MGKSYRSTILFAVAVVMLLTVGGLFQGSLQSGSYSPAPAMIWQGENIIVYGRLMYDNNTPAVGIEVRMFAVDELFDVYDITDGNGYFGSVETFEAGQFIKVEVDGERLFPTEQEEDYQQDSFIQYDQRASDEFFLGTYIWRPVV